MTSNNEPSEAELQKQLTAGGTRVPADFNAPLDEQGKETAIIKLAELYSAQQ